MARFNKMQVLDAIVSTGMVPVYYNKDVEIAKQVVKACYEGGVRAFEFTNRGDFAHEVFAELIKFAAKECPVLAIGGQLHRRSVVQSGNCKGVQPSLSPVYTRMRFRFGNRFRPRSWL